MNVTVEVINKDEWSFTQLTLIVTTVFCVVRTAQVEVEGQQQVDEEIRQLLCGVGGQTVLNHIQQELQERGVQML